MKKFSMFMTILATGAVLGIGFMSNSSVLLVVGLGLTMYTLYKV